MVWFVSCVIWLASINITKRERDDARREAEAIELEQKKYDKLLEQVRLREHEFNNHMTAILATHYTYRTYDKLVEAQSEYCKRMLSENKYNRLVLMQDKVFAAFLYEKLTELEAQGIEVEYKYRAEGEPGKCHISTYQLIEMAGILLDNAEEAVKDKTDRRICVEMYERGDRGTSFKVRNVHEYVPYSTIQGWFEKGVSSKGTTRGLGLYHLKQLCTKNNCSICCENYEIDGENWIAFSFITNAAKYGCSAAYTSN